MNSRSTQDNPTPAKSTRAVSKKPVRIKTSRTHKPEELDLEEWQRQLRQQYGEQQEYRLENRGNHPIFSDFLLTNPQSQKTYKIAIRGKASGDNYCSCPDFSINNLGICKHIAFTLSRLMNIKGAEEVFRKGCKLPYSEVFLHYGLKREVRFRAGSGAPAELRALAKHYFDERGFLREERILDFRFSPFPRWRPPSKRT